MEGKVKNFPFFKTETLIKSFAITSKLKLRVSFLGNGKCLCDLLREREKEKRREILHLKIHSIWKNNKRAYCSFIQKGQETQSWNTESRTIEPGCPIWSALALLRLLPCTKIHFSFSQWATRVRPKPRASLQRSRAGVHVNTMRSSTNKKALERTYTSQCQGLVFVVEFLGSTLGYQLCLMMAHNSSMEFTSTKFSTTLKNINKIGLYCLVNRADTISVLRQQYFQKHPNPSWPMHNTSNYTQIQVQEPTNCCYSNMFWALSYRQHVHPKDPTEYNLWQHLGFCTVKPKPSLNGKRKRRRERKTKWALNQSDLVSTPAFDYFKWNQQKEADCTWFRLLTQIVVHVFRLHTHWSSWEKLGSVSSMHFSACTVKEDQEFPSMTELCPFIPILWNLSSRFYLHASEYEFCVFSLSFFSFTPSTSSKL